MLIVNGSLKAVFKDGYIVDEEKQNDVSILLTESNCFKEILYLIKNPNVHGELLKLICRIGDDNKEINWKVLPKNSIPIRIRSMHTNLDSKQQNFIDKIEFGYEYFNNVGKKIENTNYYLVNRGI
ncbi:hypothetical protein EBR37_00805 [bacterium]|nr:hypothetical protein [bacterium]